MRTAIFLFTAILAHSTIALSENVYLPIQPASPGSSVVLPVMFTSQTGSVSGIQFDLQYDNSVMTVVATVGDALRSSGKQLYSADLAPNKRRFLIVGLNQNTISSYVLPSSSTLINLFISLNPNTPAGLYPLTLSDVIAANPAGQHEPLAGVDNGAVQVEGAIGQGVRLQPSGVLSAASLVPGPVAPGEIVTLIGSGIGPASAQQPETSPGSTVLAGTRVLFDGTPAPLLYAAPSQINLVVPYAVSGKSTTRIQVTDAAGVIAELPLSVAASAPAIFTLDSSGAGPGVILNQDSTVNSPSNPAVRGSVVTLYATGAGETDPPGIDGQIAADPLPRPALPVSVQIDGVEAEIQYAGAAPGLIAGALQVNCRVPPNVARGDEVPIVLQVGTARSQSGVTLAVQ